MSLQTLAELADLRSEQDSTLIHTCDTTRHSQSGTDDDGQPTYTTAANLVAEPCHFLPPRAGGEIENGEILASVTNPQIILALGTDVTKTDTVSQVRDEYGTVIGGPYNVLRVDIRAMHLALQLEEVS